MVCVDRSAGLHSRSRSVRFEFRSPGAAAAFGDIPRTVAAVSAGMCASASAAHLNDCTPPFLTSSCYTSSYTNIVYIKILIVYMPG